MALTVSEPKHWYVYLHETDEGIPYYCGKGTGDRDEIRSRNQFHDRLVEKHGLNIRRLASFLSEEDAYEFEIQMIAEYRLNRFATNYEPSLFATNMDGGGLGRREYRYTDEQLVQHRIRCRKPSFLANVSRASKEVQNRPDVKFKKSKLRYEHTRMIVQNIVVIIERINCGESRRSIAKELNVSHSTLSWHVLRFQKSKV